MKRFKLIGLLAACLVALLIFPFPNVIPQDLAFDYLARDPLPLVRDDPIALDPKAKRFDTPELPLVGDDVRLKIDDTAKRKDTPILLSVPDDPRSVVKGIERKQTSPLLSVPDDPRQIPGEVLRKETPILSSVPDDPKVPVSVVERRETPDLPFVGDDTRIKLESVLRKETPSLLSVPDDPKRTPQDVVRKDTPSLPGVPDDPRPTIGQVERKTTSGLPTVRDDPKSQVAPIRRKETPSIPSLQDDPRGTVNPVQRLQTQQLPQVADEQFQRGQFLFDGAWLPDEDPAKIGAKNYVTLQNLRYTDTSLEGILGYSKINLQAYYIGGGDGDDNTTIMYHGEAANGDPITDSSGYDEGSMTKTGSADISTARKKYGLASIFGDGVGDYASDGGMPQLLLGSDNFTIDFWVNFVDPEIQTGFMAFGSDGNDAYYSIYYIPDEEVLLFYGTDGVPNQAHDYIWITGTWIPKEDTWYHIAVIRGWNGNANDFAITVNGAAIATATDSTALKSVASTEKLRLLSGNLRNSANATHYELDWGVNHFIIEQVGSAANFFQSVSISKFGTGSWCGAGGGQDIGRLNIEHTNSKFNISNGVDYAIEAFIKLDTHATNEAIIGIPGNFKGLRFAHNHGTGLVVTASAFTDDLSMSGGEITDTDWHHVAALMMADGNAGLYLDGTQVAHDTFDGIKQVVVNLDAGILGRSSIDWQGISSLDGCIDEVRWYVGDPYSASPDAGLTDTITVPTAAFLTDANTTLLVHGEPYYLSGYLDEYRQSDVALWTADFSVIGGAPASMIQLQSPYETTSYVLITGNNDSAGESNVIHNETDIPDQGNFAGGQLNANPLNANSGRFSRAPNGNIAYTNGDQSMIWGGDEMRTAGFIVVTSTSASYADLTYATDETVTTAGGNFITDGFLPGKVITITGSASNNRNFTIKSLSASIITVVEDGMAAEGGGASGTFTVAIPDLDPIDLTREITNSLQDEGNVARLTGGNDSDTVLLMHMDGVDASTTFTDSSGGGHSPSANGNVVLTTGTSKFGTASSTYDGTGDYITVADSADWNMADGRFTVDFWVKFDSGLTEDDYVGLFQQTTNPFNFVIMYMVDGAVRFEIFASGEKVISVKSPLNLVTGVWYHLSINRGWSGNANDWALTVNGSPGSVITSTVTWEDYTGNLEIGRAFASGTTRLLTGQTDEFRVSKGVSRWTSSFAPYITQYRGIQSGTISQSYVLATRPLQGLKFYLSQVNASSSSMTIKGWNGKSFQVLKTTDGTALGGVSLAQDGTITWDSTVGDAAPFHFEGTFLYAYLLELSAGSAEVYQITSNAPFQQIVDIWDEIPRRPIAFNVWDDSTETFRDYTVEVNANSDTSNSAWGGEIGATTSSDYIIAIFDERQAALNWLMIAGKVNTAAAIPTIEYWDGIQWVTVGVVRDRTIADPLVWQTLGGSGIMSWKPPGFAEEKTLSDFGVTGYGYKISFDATLSGSSSPPEPDIIVDRLFGIPAQNIIHAFSFPQMHKDRLMLFSYIKGGEGNRVDFSQKNAPDVWNGEDSSQGGEHGNQSLFFGGRENITAATSVFNRYGSNIFTALLVLKDTETYLLVGDGPPATSDNPYRIFPLSDTIGCPAPHTLVTAEVAFEVGESEKRNLAIWMGYSGVWLFNGSVPQPINGINKFFDPNDADFINYAAIDRSHAFYNPRFKEYNLFIPSGSGQTTINKWLVYDLVRQRWSERVPTDYPQATTAVIDTDGARYIYGGLDNGFMVRLENATTWDGDAIASVVETGDFFPTASFWDKTYIRKFKVAASAISEASKNLTITVYTDTEASGTVLGTTLDLDGETGTERLVRNTQSMPDTIGPAWTYRFKFEVSTSATGPDLDLFGWGYLFRVVREDF